MKIQSFPAPNVVLKKPFIIIPMVFVGVCFSCSNRINHGTEILSQNNFDFAEFKKSFDTNCCGWTGGDGVYSIELNKDKSVFVFGDTYLGTVNEDNSRDNTSPVVKNSMVVWDRNKITSKYSGTPENPRPFFETQSPDSTWYWPGHGFLLGKDLFCFLSEFKKSGNGVFGFEWQSTSIAKIDTTIWETAQINAWDHGTDIHFGNAVYKEGDYLYVFGIKAFRMYIARVNVADLNSWSYFDSSTWTKDSKSASPIDSVYISEQFSFFKRNKKYIIVSQGAILDKDIFAYTSESMTDSWSAAKKIYETTERSADSTLFTYNALAHPQFSNGDSLLISYCVNSTDFISIYENVDRYRPKFISIPYERIFNSKINAGDNPNRN